MRMREEEKSALSRCFQEVVRCYLTVGIQVSDPMTTVVGDELLAEMIT